MATLGKLNKDVLSQILKFLSPIDAVKVARTDREMDVAVDIALANSIAPEADCLRVASKRRKLDDKQTGNSIFSFASRCKNAEVLNKLLHKEVVQKQLTPAQIQELETRRASLATQARETPFRNFSRIR